MVSNRCKMAVKDVLNKFGLHYILVDLGVVDVMEEVTSETRIKLNNALLEYGLEIMEDKKAILVENIIVAIINLIHHNDEALKVNYSDYLSELLNYDYTYLSNLFTEIKGTTIQQFIIVNKIERAKELIIYDEMNLSEISYLLHYSSVAHLSNQFKKITGLTPSQFKQLKKRKRTSIEDILN